MTFSELKGAAKKAGDARLQSRDADIDLRDSLDAYLREWGDASGLAGKIGISPQYLSDIRNGRRLISTTFIEELLGVKGVR